MHTDLTTDRFVLDLDVIDRTQIALAGGKGAQLGMLRRIDGVRVPDGFCVTTDAFRLVIAQLPSLDGLLDRLAPLSADDRASIRTISAEIRDIIEAAAVPAAVATPIIEAIERRDERTAYAVRSSATAEDLPTASFAGQQDTYLNVIGSAGVLRHVSLCWASLFTERAVTYRIRNGFDHRRVQMAVIVQAMLVPDAAGILFTADPATSDRTVCRVEAGFGLGESLVSGLVNPDVITVRNGAVVDRVVGAKHLAIRAAPGGGTHEQLLDPSMQQRPALTDEQAVQLAQLGRRIEAHAGCPQDIEWCLVGDELHVVQSRPITTLFPIPVADDDANHVYVSVGHQQMMTDAMKPLGLSLWQLTAMVPMHEAGGRLFVDVAARLASPTSRAAVLAALGESDPLIGDALRAILDRGDFITTLPDDDASTAPLMGIAPTEIETDPAIVIALRERAQASITALRDGIEGLSGAAVIDFILDDIVELKRVLTDPQSFQVLMAGMGAASWLNTQLQTWLGEKNAADALSQSAPGNVTAEMGLALLDVADVIRPHDAVVAVLERAHGDEFLDHLLHVDGDVEGGLAARAAIVSYLDRYGMRCAGEIDITRPRWSERPSTLVPMILGNVKNFGPGEARRRFEHGHQQAASKEQDVLARLRMLPDGATKVAETKRMIDRVRTFTGYREFPKYAIVCRYQYYKAALTTEADRLVRAGAIDDRDDIFFLTVHELGEVVRTGEVDRELVAGRRAAFAMHQALTPPRVLTSDGEVVTGAYRRDDLPDGALAGLAVSSGSVVGRARVVLDVAAAELEPGDILVTAFTDPSWTPLFVSIAGLVTEVGGLMTHGAVIAREYGVPAVVGVERATSLIRDGQRIRVNGTDGYVEILDDAAAV